MKRRILSQTASGVASVTAVAMSNLKQRVILAPHNRPCISAVTHTINASSGQHTALCKVQDSCNGGDGDRIKKSETAPLFGQFSTCFHMRLCWAVCQEEIHSP